MDKNNLNKDDKDEEEQHNNSFSNNEEQEDDDNEKAEQVNEDEEAEQIYEDDEGEQVNEDDEDEQNDDDEQDNDDERDKEEESEFEDSDEGEEYNDEFNRQDIIDSIVIARETYLFSYINEDENISDRNERFILKFIYEQLANLYRDVSLIQLLLYIKHYYNLNYPEHDEIFNLFYISVYPQAVATDRLTAGFVQIADNRNEIPNSFIGVNTSTMSNINTINNIINNIINPTDDQNTMINSLFNNIINPSNEQNSLFNREDNSLNRHNYNNSLLSEISFLATIFNMQTNESVLHILNLINSITNLQEEKQVASEFQIKELKNKSFNELEKEILDKNSDFCSICQETYDNDNNQVKILSCGHFFHCTCIEPWLLNCSNLCPICRNKI